jgi:hypothetical protein
MIESYARTPLRYGAAAAPSDDWRDELSEIRRRAGRLGGRVKAMRYAARRREGTQAARAAFRKTFEEGKHDCRLCRDRAPRT